MRGYVENREVVLHPFCPFSPWLSQRPDGKRELGGTERLSLNAELRE